MKLQELKAKVYELAGVNNTKQLKAKNKEIQTLDMRLKTSWEKTLAILQTSQSEFEDWLKNPPEEYKDIFSEITEVSQKYDQKSAQTKQQAREVLSIANNLEELAGECQDEVDQIKQEFEITRRISKQARLN
jgi:methyl-accepting chemotaxis protein